MGLTSLIRYCKTTKDHLASFPPALPWGCSITHPHIHCRFLQCGDQWASQTTHTDNKGARPALAAQYNDLGRFPPFPLFHPSSSSLTHISTPHTGLVDAPKSGRRITIPVPPSLSVYCTPNTFLAFVTPSLSAMLETSLLLVLDVYYVTYFPTLLSLVYHIDLGLAVHLLPLFAIQQLGMLASQAYLGRTLPMKILIFLT